MGALENSDNSTTDNVGKDTAAAVSTLTDKVHLSIYVTSLGFRFVCGLLWTC